MPHLLAQKQRELHTLVREQLRHYCERGKPQYLVGCAYTEEATSIYDGCARGIVNGLEVRSTVAEHEEFLEDIRRNPRALEKLYKEYLEKP